MTTPPRPAQPPVPHLQQPGETAGTRLPARDEGAPPVAGPPVSVGEVPAAAPPAGATAAQDPASPAAEAPAPETRRSRRTPRAWPPAAGPQAADPAHALPPALHGGAERLLEEEPQRVELLESVVIHASVTHEPLDLALARGAVAEHTNGAVVVFEGVIRSHDGDHEDVTSLEYTAHPQASEYLTVVAGEIAAVTPGVHIFVQHRIGHLDVGDVALLAVVGSAHRGAAFATCAELVDRVKERVPIWKQQHFASGSHEWVGL